MQAEWEFSNKKTEKSLSCLRSLPILPLLGGWQEDIRLLHGDNVGGSGGGSDHKAPCQHLMQRRRPTPLPVQALPRQGRKGGRWPTPEELESGDGDSLPPLSICMLSAFLSPCIEQTSTCDFFLTVTLALSPSTGEGYSWGRNGNCLHCKDRRLY